MWNSYNKIVCNYLLFCIDNNKISKSTVEMLSTYPERKNVKTQIIKNQHQTIIGKAYGAQHTTFDIQPNRTD